MKKIITFLMLILLCFYVMGGEYHDIQQITSQEEYKYVTGQYNNGSGNNSSSDDDDDEDDEEDPVDPDEPADPPANPPANPPAGDSNGNGGNGGNSGSGGSGGNGGSSGGGNSSQDEEIKKLEKQIAKLEEELKKTTTHDKTPAATRAKQQTKEALEKQLADKKKKLEEDQTENQGEIEEELAEENSETGGDPVRLTVGSYEQSESDIIITGVQGFEITRKYNSENKVTSSLGYGWTTNLDQRIILGVSAVAQGQYEALTEYLNQLNQNITAFETEILQGYNVQSLETGEAEITSSLEKCLEIEEEAKKLPISSELAERAHAKAEENRAALEAFREALSLLGQLRADYETKRQEAENLYINEVLPSIERHNRNSKVLFNGMREDYDQTGRNTVIIIDENGYPHLLFESVTGNGIWEKEGDDKLLRCEASGSGYQVTCVDGRIQIYDENGFLIKITDRNGNFIHIKRDGNGKISELETSFGEKYNFEYSGAFISKITNVRSSDESVTYAYSGNYLVSVCDTDGDTVTMTYDSDGRMTALNKCDGSSVNFTYGEMTSDGRLLTTATTDEEGNTEYFEYDRSGSYTTYTNHDGEKTLYFYDSKHRTVREERPDGSIIQNEYDDYDNLIRTNENGSVTLFSYDDLGNKTQASYNDGSHEYWTYDSYGKLTSHTDRDGVREEYQLDEMGNITEYRLGGSTVYTQSFDSKGQVISHTVFGEKRITTNFEYDDFGNLIIEDCGGVRKEYEYDSRNRLTKIRLADHLQAEYQYDGHRIVEKAYNGLETEYLTNGRKDLVKITQKDLISGKLHQLRIEYDRRHKPVKIFAGDGQTEKLTAAYLYTPEGKLKAEISYGAESWIKRYEYHNGQISGITQFKRAELTATDEQITMAVEPVENMTQKITYEIQNTNRRLIKVTNGLEESSLFEYDSYGNLIKATDANGDVMQRRFTRAGRINGEQNPYGGWYEYGYDSSGFMNYAAEQGKQAVHQEYFPDGSVKSITDRYGRLTYYHYDERGRLLSTQSEAEKVWYEYDDSDRITKKLVGNSPDISSAIYYVTYEFSEDGRKVTVTEGGKYKTVYELDAFGNVVKETDGNANERSYVYNPLNQLTESYDAYGNKTLYDYNALGNVSKVIQPDGAEISYQYNSIGLIEKISDDCGTLYSASYDKAGRLIKEKSRADSEKSYEYDRGGRLIKVLCGGEVVEEYTYVDANRTVTVKDGRGNDYIYNYDAFGRLIKERNRKGLEQNFFYDEDGQLKSENVFDGGTNTITYSSDRTVRTIRYSDGSENIFVYDMTGNIIEAENAYGKTLFRYDQGGRLLYQNDLTTGEEVYFDYDNAGNRIRLYSSNRETLYTYGRNNEVKEIFDNKQRVSIKLKYDMNGREVERSFGNGTKEETLYDKAGRVTAKIQKDSHGQILWGEGYVYGTDGKCAMTVDNSGRVTFYEYNRKGQLETVYYPYSQELEAGLKKEAERNGLPITAASGENRFLTSSEKTSLIVLLNSMQYGLAYNLPNLHVLVKEAYEYDGNGNRTAKIIPYGKIEYTYDEENCMLASGSKGQKLVNYTYDNMGNLLTEESSDKSIKYAYNAQNRLIYCEVTDRSEKEYSQTTYSYDAFGRRILVQDKGEAALRTLYDGFTFDVIKQSPTFQNGLFTDSQNNGIRWGSTGRPTGDRYRYLGDDNTKDENRYIYLDDNTYKTVSSRYRGERTQLTVNGTIAAQTTSDYGTNYFTTDLLGSVTSITDHNGSQKSAFTYDAFGSLIQGSLTAATDLGYLGKQHDPTSTLYNYGYRDYKPQTARFTTVDPIRDGSNWFSYCNGDPVNFVDLWGQAPRNLSVEDREAYMNKINEYKDYVNNSNEMGIPDDYDCADTMTYLYGQGTSVTSLGNQAGNLKHNGQKIGTNITNIHSSDFFPSNTSNITFYSEKDFNNPNVEIGTVLVWEADPGANWTGHTATVVDVTRDSDGNVTNIKIIQGHTGGNKTEVVDIPNQNDLNSYRGTFHGFGELGQNSTIPFEKPSNY